MGPSREEYIPKQKNQPAPSITKANPGINVVEIAEEGEIAPAMADGTNQNPFHILQNMAEGSGKEQVEEVHETTDKHGNGLVDDLQEEVPQKLNEEESAAFIKSCANFKNNPKDLIEVVSDTEPDESEIAKFIKDETTGASTPGKAGLDV